MLSSPPRSSRSCCTSASSCCIESSSATTPIAISMPMAQLSSSTSPIAATLGSDLLTRLPSPKPVVPASPVRVEIAERRLPMPSPAQLLRRVGPQRLLGQCEHCPNLCVAAGRSSLTAVGPVLTRHLCAERDGIVQALHSQTPVVHANAACKQCKRSISGQLALPVVCLDIHTVPQQLLHFSNRLPRHR